jgi:hypothetical protein
MYTNAAVNLQEETSATFKPKYQFVKKKHST